jgi:hypothetical protein
MGPRPVVMHPILIDTRDSDPCYLYLPIEDGLRTATKRCPQRTVLSLTWRERRGL